VIAGGETKDHTEVIDGKLCLAVPVVLTGVLPRTRANGAAETEPVFAATFDITYDPEQLTYVSCITPVGSPFTLSGINGTQAGVVRCAFASTEGADVGEGVGLVMLYFTIADTVEAGDEIAFALAEAFAETQSADHPVAKPIDAAFSPYTVSETTALTGTVVFDEGAVQWKGTTPYVVWDAENPVCGPGFTVQDEEGNVIDPENYGYCYKENTRAGTAYIFVTFCGAYSGSCMGWFKIYLPAFERLTVENVADGILLNWAPVEGAAGYVIYRRAWNSTSDGWTDFARWWNVTGTMWTDGADENHKVYAGTRYQYGVKAYFERRVDPIKNEEIGGNVNEPSGNYNLGVV
jgi:hypothetical protein